MIDWMRRATLSLFVLSALVSKDTFACGKQGFCDLTGSSISWNEGILLNGEWQFYWKQLLTPDEVQQGKGQLTGYLAPDVDWWATDFSGAILHSEPFATYHMNFEVSSTDPLTIKFPRLPSAVIFWVNGEKVGTIGQLSTR